MTFDEYADTHYEATYVPATIEEPKPEKQPAMWRALLTPYMA